MPVTAKAEYACLAMLELAARYAEGRPVRLAEVTDKHGIHHGFIENAHAVTDPGGFKQRGDEMLG